MSSSSIIKEMAESQSWDDGFASLTKGLTSLVGRIPTEEEVKRYIYGDEEEREAFLENHGS